MPNRINPKLEHFIRFFTMASTITAPNIYLKNTLDNRMKDLSKQGKVAPCEKAEPISSDEQELIWKNKVLRDSSPVQLINTIIYLNGVHFALHAAEEHKNLKVNCQFQVLFDTQVHLKYLHYKEMTSKCNQGGLTSRFHQPKEGRPYENVVK